MAMFPLGVLLELLLNGTWVDGSRFLYQRSDITITGGRGRQADKPQPAQMTFTVNNRDGRFTTTYAGGAYYPYLTRNTQIRLTVTATSSSGNFYSGYRFWGEVPEWPPLSDISGNDVYVDVTAAGVLRRLRQGGGKGGALTRYYNSLTGVYAPVAYWPCEEDPLTGQVNAGIDGGQPMTVTGTPLWKAVSAFNGSGPVGVLNRSAWDGLTGSVAFSGNDVFNVPGTHTWTAPAAAVDCRCWGPGGFGFQGNLSGGGDGGGSGEEAEETALAVTAGKDYQVTIVAGGSGLAQTFAGDAVTVTAHPGGDASSSTPGVKGTGSTNALHHDGAAGGNNTANAGGGGASSGGTGAAGNAGGNASGSTGGAGGTPVAGGGAGGAGGNLGKDGKNGVVPGGGSGGGGGGVIQSPGTPAAGQVQFIYTPPSAPTNAVTRFVLFVPPHGGNNGNVLVRALGGGTIARLDCIYGAGGVLRLKGYNNAASLLFTSSDLAAGADGQPLLVSMELAPSGANVAYKLTAIVPGATTAVGSVTGTQSAATIGSVSEVIAGPNGDITKTAIGHISVQYGLIDITKVSRALDGHNSEMGIDRFIRLANEQAIDQNVEFAETYDHFGFEPGTQGWAATNGALTQSAVTHTNASGVQDWPPDGSHSLLCTCNGSGIPSALSPAGTSGIPIQALDWVSVDMDMFCPAALTGTLTAQVRWYTAAGATIGTDSGTAVTPAANTPVTLRFSGPSPATAAFFAVRWTGSATEPNLRLVYCDNVRIHPRMGPQTRKEYHRFLEEIEDLDQGIMREARALHGLVHKTRIALFNQSPAVTLDYSAGTLSPPLTPLPDDKRIKNDITVHRHKGSRRRRTLGGGGGPLSTAAPPAGVGPYRKELRVIAERDEQLQALADHLLTLGTVTDERFPAITVDLRRAALAGNAVAPLMSAVAAVEIGQVVKLINLPFWFPQATAQCLVLGYSETINAHNWTITWNTVPYSPYVQISGAPVIRIW